MLVFMFGDRVETARLQNSVRNRNEDEIEIDGTSCTIIRKMKQARFFK